LFGAETALALLKELLSGPIRQRRRSIGSAGSGLDR
jgi:hypothetical protein